MRPVAALLAEALQAPTNGPVCVGLSGGLDSTVLLHALAGIAAVRERGLRAWHVHHGLHPDADQWAGHCQAFCDGLALPLSVSRVTVSRGDGQGLEAAARHARHGVFTRGLADGEILAFAHHLDDQAETFLLRAMRASGPDGLGSMQPWRKFGRSHLWRPLLGLSRATLEAYAAEHRLRWIEDPSNNDESFDRNFLRQRVLPLLQERWPHAAASLARSAALCEQAATLLDIQDSAALSDVIANAPACLSRSRLSQLPPARRARVLRHWIGTMGLPPLPAAGIAQIESALLPSPADASANFVWHGAVIHAWRDLLHAGPLQPPLPDQWQAAWDGTAPLPLPGGGTLALDPAIPDGFGRSLLVHARRGGERITLPGRGHSHALKQVLQDFAIPPWQRVQLPLLATTEGELLAAGDRIRSAALDQWLRDHDACLQWRPTAPEPSLD
ncbi:MULTISPECIES: tRNA lysidine(34) synthetase TilS [unclassified Lysobacter]